MNKAMKIVGMVIGGLALAAGLAFLLGFVVQALWNWLMPDLFGLAEIGYWQAWGLLVLSHLLLGGGPKFNHHKHKDMDKNNFREKLRDRIHGRVGFCQEPEGEESPAPDGAA